MLLRASFGIFGANIPALLRRLVACGWFGIQTWIGGAAIHQLMAAVLLGVDPAGSPAAALGSASSAWASWLGFMIFWAVNVWSSSGGIESIRLLEKFARAVPAG